jgi:hypothetical protein
VEQVAPNSTSGGSDQREHFPMCAQRKRGSIEQRTGTLDRIFAGADRTRGVGKVPNEVQIFHG